jgi:hypothetical protein
VVVGAIDGVDVADGMAEITVVCPQAVRKNIPTNKLKPICFMSCLPNIDILMNN